MKEFKIRASMIGAIMTNPKSKTEKLSKTTMTYCQEWLKEELYGMRKEVYSKYTEKGIVMEGESISFLIEKGLMPMCFKNEERFENNFIIGTPDLIHDGYVEDIKNSYDFTTFPLFEEEIPNKDYYYQLQGYMAMTGIKKAKLTYVLMNTPDEVDIYCNFDYTSLPTNLRVKSYDVEYDEEVVKQIEERVVLCREYINELLEKL